MIFDFGSLSRNATYSLMTQLVLPRPIAWVLTAGPTGIFNLAPFSYFNAVSSQPALLMFSVDLQPDRKTLKDTRRNIEHGSSMVIHIAHDHQAAKVNASSAPLPPEVSEIAELDMELVDFSDFKLPRLASAPIAFGCRWHKTIEIAKDQMLIFGRIETAHVTDAALSRDQRGRCQVDPTVIRPLSRLGAGSFANFGKSFQLSRPT